MRHIDSSIVMFICMFGMVYNLNNDDILSRHHMLTNCSGQTRTE